MELFFAQGRSSLVVVQGVEVLYWPSRSPDLNPIEHIWDELGCRVRQQVNPSQTLGDLERALVEQWKRLPQAVFTNVLRSMRRRCVAVRDARGGHNRYCKHKMSQSDALQPSTLNIKNVVPCIVVYNPSLPSIGKTIHKYWDILTLSKNPGTTEIFQIINLWWLLKDKKI